MDTGDLWTFKDSGARSRFTILFIFVAVLATLGQAPHQCRVPVQLTAFDQGALVASATATVSLHDAPTAGSELYSDDHTITNSRLDVDLVLDDLNYGDDIFMDLDVDTVDQDWGSGPTERQRFKFWGGRVTPAWLYMNMSLSMNSQAITGLDSITGADGSLDIATDAGDNLVFKVGDAAGSNKVSFTDSSDAEVLSIDSDGEINAAANADLVVQMADDGGTYSFSIEDSGGAEVAYIDSDGDALLVDVTTTSVSGDGSGLTGIVSAGITDNTITLTDVAAGALPFLVVDAGGSGDHATIDAAVDAGSDMAVYVRAGTYQECITITQDDIHLILAAGVEIDCDSAADAIDISGSRVTVEGAGRSTYVHADGNGHAVDIASGGGGSGARVKHLYLQQTTTGNTKNCIYNQQSDTIIEDIFCDQSDNHGIEVQGGSNVAIIDCEVDSTNVDASALRIDSAPSRVRVEGGYYHDGAASQIMAYVESDYLDIGGVTFEDAGTTTLYVREANYTRIHNCMFINGGDDAISVYDSTDSTLYFAIDNNEFINCNDKCININAANHGAITGNVMRGGADTNWGILNNADEVSGVANVVIDNMAAGGAMTAPIADTGTGTEFDHNPTVP